MAAITLHDVALSSLPIGIECSHCIRHSLMTAEKVRASFGDTRTLEEAGVYCGNCGSRTFTVVRFTTRSQAFNFMRNH